jgi:hypothetical protein
MRIVSIVRIVRIVSIVSPHDEVEDEAHLQ